MKSRTSFFNRGVAKNLLQRCWPLWAAYFAFLLLILPLMLRQQVLNNTGYMGLVPLLDDTVAGMGEEMMIISFVISILAAMAMFGYLYQPRACGMMNALPITRSTMFFTAWLTGLVPLLLADLLAVALCLPFVPAGELSLRVLGTLLLIMFCSKLCFYGFASLCAMLTGSLLILPLVYAVLNFTAYVAEYATRFVLSKVLFGLSTGNLRLSWLSPLVYMMGHYSFSTMGKQEEIVIRGLPTVCVYGGVGILLTLLAWRLYLRRRMESATDTVAIPVLKPVFKYCMAYGCGVLLAAFVHDALVYNQQTGLAAALFTALAVLVGSLIGYFAAEMLIRKTVWVFRGTWRGWLIFAAIAVLILGLCEADVLGWEKRQPEAERVQAVLVNGTEYQEPESIRRILELQRGIVQNKAQHERPVAERVGSCASCHLTLDYLLDSGKTVSRAYNVWGPEESLSDPNSDMAKLQTVLNLPEALRQRSVSEVQVIPENVIGFGAEFEGSEEYGHRSVYFTEEEAVDFYENALLADLAENKIGRRFLSDAAAPRSTNVSIHLEITDGAAYARGYLRNEDTSWYYLTIYEDNTHCLDWLRAHCDEEIRIAEDMRYPSYGTDLIGG